MNIKDVSYLAILEKYTNVIYAMNFDNINTEELHSILNKDTDAISLYNDRSLFLYRNNDIIAVLLTKPDSNDIFVYNAFKSLIDSLDKIVKEWICERFGEKYDQVLIALNEFVYNGIILTDQTEDLNKRIMNRTFENISGIKVNKGFASFLNKATKSLRNN